MSKQEKGSKTRTTSGKAAGGSNDQDDISLEEKQRMQREELERRRAMDAEAKQHFAGVDDEEEDEYDGPTKMKKKSPRLIWTAILTNMMMRKMTVMQSIWTN